LLQEHSIQQAFVFVNSKLGCARLARDLERDGLKTTALHGDKSQDERLKALEAFKKGEVDLLVCTDVAARGLDIKDVPAVFNIDVPFNAEDYVHRIGRTGRAGASGLAISFVSGKDSRLVGDIEKLIKIKIDLLPLNVDGGRGARPEGRSERGSERGNDRSHERGFDRERSSERAPRRDYARPAPAPRDPFFDKPYEAPAVAEAVADNAVSAGASSGSPGLSPNIKPKRKVAALFKTT
jgi:superfamily II DNA/RNA helicase